MPNNKMLEELLEMNILFTQLCQEQGEQRGASPFIEGVLSKAFLRVLESRKGRQREAIGYAYNLRSIPQFLATTTPSLLEVALGFDKVVEFIPCCTRWLECLVN